MEIYQSYQSRIIVGFQQVMYTAEPCFVEVAVDRNWDSDRVVLCLETRDNSYHLQSLLDNDRKARFDISPYLRAEEYFTIDRFVYNLRSDNDDAFCLKPSIAYWSNVYKKESLQQQQLTKINEVLISKTLEQSEVGDYEFRIVRPRIWCFNGSNPERTNFCATRYHLWNPRFPHYHEFVDTYYDDLYNNKAHLQLYIDGDTPTMIEKPIATNEMIADEFRLGLNSILINDYVDVSEFVPTTTHNWVDYYAHVLTIDNPFSLEPEAEWQKNLIYTIKNTVPNKNYIWADKYVIKDEANGFTGQKKDIYLFDNRNDISRLVCLRFIDNFGCMQQLTLTLKSEEYVESEGDALNVYHSANYHPNYTVRNQAGRMMTTQQGSRTINNHTQTKVYHLSFEKMPKCLAEDVRNLMNSPLVVWVRPKGNLADYQNSTNILAEEDFIYTKVNLSAKNLVVDAKRNNITFTADMSL